MKRTKKLTIVSIVLFFSLLSSVVMPTSVLADDSTPPPADTPVVVPPTDEPVITEVPTEAPVTVVTPSPEATLSADPAATEVPAGQDPSDQASEPVNLTEVVDQLNSSNLVLLDEDGQTIPLASQQAVDALTAPDPIGCPPGVLPIAWGGTGIGCTTSYTSIQAAIDDPLVTAGWTIYVEAGTLPRKASRSWVIQVVLPLQVPAPMLPFCREMARAWELPSMPVVCF
jgi:hypothetical protein